jgi:small subunit ribosomal protein S18
MAKNNALKKEKFCYFATHPEVVIDYKNVDLLRRYISSFGKIVPTKRSGVSKEYQRKLATEIKRARVMGLLPFVQK